MPGKNIPPKNNHRRNRPRTITIISMLFFLFSLFNLLKLIQVFLQWKTLISLQLSISPFRIIHNLEFLVWEILGKKTNLGDHIVIRDQILDRSNLDSRAYCAADPLDNKPDPNSDWTSSSLPQFVFKIQPRLFQRKSCYNRLMGC